MGKTFKDKKEFKLKLRKFKDEERPNKKPRKNNERRIDFDD